MPSIMMQDDDQCVTKYMKVLSTNIKNGNVKKLATKKDYKKMHVFMIQFEGIGGGDLSRKHRCHF